MRKTKLLAFIMTLAMLLSALLVPVSAVVNAGDGDGAYSGDPTALLLKNTTLDDGFQESSWGTATIDGTKDDVYKEYTHVKSNIDNKASGASFDVWYVNDGTYIYYYLNVNMPSSKTEYAANDQIRFYADFYNQHDKVYVQKTPDNKYQVYLEDDRQDYANVDTLRSAQLQYGVKNESVSAATYMGTKDTDYKFVKETTSYVLEGRILLPKYIQTAIAQGERPVIGWGYEIRNNTQAPQYVLGYFDPDSYEYLKSDEFNYIWDDYSLCADMVLSAENNNTQLRTVTPEAVANVNITDKAFEVNGTMDANEGWASAPYFTFGGQLDSVTNPYADIYLSTDYENLYVYIDAHAPINRAYFYLQLDDTISKIKEGGFDKFLALTVQGKCVGTDTMQHSNGTAYSTTDGSAFGQTTYSFNEECSTLEIKVPMTTAMKETLGSGDLTFKIGNIIRFWDGDGTASGDYTTQIGSNNAASNSLNWNNGTLPVTIPQLPADSTVEVEGFQTRKETTTDVRFVASLQGEYTDYEALGFEFTLNGN
ncbi:MAG: hypothetical protein IJ011_03945, partial [Clostridia bacterium]|nr:hypothetical protein [Clostridia bacterium]